MDDFRKDNYPSLKDQFGDQFGDIKQFTQTNRREIPSVKDLLFEFTQETSIHGVKYITSDNSSIFRR